MNKTGRIKILYLDHSAVWSGGEVALYNLCRGLNKEAFEPVVITSSYGPFTERLCKAGIKTAVLPLDDEVRLRKKDEVGLSTILRPDYWLKIFLYARKLVEIIARENIDIVQTCSLKAHVYGSIASKMCRKPLIWYVLDQIDEDYLPGPATGLIRLLARLVPDRVVAISASNWQVLRVKPDKSHIIPCGVAVPRYPPPLPHAPPYRVAMIGRIAPWKGQMIFLEAAKLLQDEPVEFIIAGAPLFGEQQYEYELKEMARKNRLEQVKFLGFVDNIADLLEKIHIVVHCSLSPEPFGQVVTEAMAAARLVIAAQSGGPAEIIVPGKTGLLTEPGNSPALAAAIAGVIHGPEKIKQFGLGGYQEVKERFNLSAIVPRWEKIYGGLCGREDRLGPV